MGAPLTGTLTGIVGVDATNENMGGLITVTLTNDAHFTGTYRYGGTVRAFVGVAEVVASKVTGETHFKDGDRYVTVHFQLTSGVPVGGLDAYLVVESAPDFALQPVTIGFTLRRPLVDQTLPQYAGRYNFAIDYALIDLASRRVDTSLPLGYGIGSATVNKTGGIAWAGRMGDGISVFTATSLLGSDKNTSMYVPLYNGKGAFWSEVTFTSASGADPASLSGASTGPGVSKKTLWTKLSDSSVAGARSYPNGWTATPMTIEGSLWTPPDKGQIVMNLTYVPGTSNATLAFVNAGQWENGSDWPDIGFSLKSSGLIDKIPLASNPCKTTFSVVNATGLFNGSFVLNHALPNSMVFDRLVQYHGAIVRRPGRSPETLGIGSFAAPILPRLDISPIPDQNTTPILAVSAILAPK